ncbi:MAG: pilus (MSHA type) biogenesis protein MshL [Burkholderiales bacterium]
MSLSRFAACAVLALAGAACSSTPVEPGETFDRVGKELADAAASRRKALESEAARTALLPPLVPAAPAPPPGPPEQRFDLHVNNAPASEVFMSIVTGTRYSMLVHADVAGAVTVNLKDVTVHDVLETLRELYGYEYTVQGSRIMIQPIALRSRLFHVNYLAGRRRGQTDVRVSSGSISTSTTGQATGPGGTPAIPGVGGTGATTTTSSIESSRVATTSDNDFWAELTSALRTIVGTEGGRSVVVSPQSGVVVVRAFPRELRAVEDFLKATQLVVERQVMLEAKIIEVQLKDDFQSGINWSYFNNEGQHRGSVGADTRDIPLQGGTIGSLASIGGTLGAGLAGAAGRTASGIFGLALQTKNFTALLQFLEGQGNVQVLSSPRIATLNNQKAVLKVGTDEFFITNVSTTTSATGTSTTTSPTITVQPFFSGIALDVTPQIDENANIILHIHPSVSAVSEKPKVVNLGSLGSFTLPLASSNVNETDSIVRVQDGNIVAIGGLMKQEQTDGRTQVPLAGDVPVAGALFGQKSRSFLKREIVILIKPTVIEGGRGWQQDLVDTQERVQRLDPRPAPSRQP